MTDDSGEWNYVDAIKECIPDISDADLKWLNDKAMALSEELEESDGAVDNFRVSRVINDTWSAEYANRLEKGCCGSSDERYVNPLTGNNFFMGFNFGH